MINRQMEHFAKNEAIDYYGTVSVRNKTDFFSKSDKRQQTIEFLPQGAMPDLVRNNEPVTDSPIRTMDEAAINWSINEVLIQLHCEDRRRPGSPLRVDLSNNMPYHNYYEMCADEDQKFRCCDQTFVWNLQEGLNRLTVRAVNRSSVRGSASTVQVLYQR